MSGLRLISLGVGDAFSALHYSSCFLLEAEGRRLLIDCPHPIRKVFREGTLAAGELIDVDGIDGLVLTHLHGDHASGVEGLAFYYRFVLGRKLPVITHPDVEAKLWGQYLSGSMEWSRQADGLPPAQRQQSDFIDWIPIVETQTLRHGPFTLECRPTIHNIPTIALRIGAAGRTLGYSADTIFDPALIDWLASADAIVHEASGGFMHTPYESLLALPKQTRAKMRIVHYPDTFDVAKSQIEALRQGRLYQL
jgi:ribonuclease BN (tRNA processing enzyme)